MSYQIRPVDFQNGVPGNSEISEFIEGNSSQKVVIHRGLAGQFSVYFKKYPKDVLAFSRKGNNITIAGDAGEAPALCEVFYSALVALGGDQKHQIDLVKFPVSDENIREMNKEMRSILRKFGILIWGLILLLMLGLGSVIYFLLGGLFNA